MDIFESFCQLPNSGYTNALCDSCNSLDNEKIVYVPVPKTVYDSAIAGSKDILVSIPRIEEHIEPETATPHLPEIFGTANVFSDESYFWQNLGIDRDVVETPSPFEEAPRTLKRKLSFDWTEILDAKEIAFDNNLGNLSSSKETSKTSPKGLDHQPSETITERKPFREVVNYQQISSLPFCTKSVIKCGGLVFDEFSPGACKAAKKPKTDWKYRGWTTSVFGSTGQKAVKYRFHKQTSASESSETFKIWDTQQ